LLQDGALTSSASFYTYCVIAAHAQIWMSQVISRTEYLMRTDIS